MVFWAVYFVPGKVKRAICQAGKVSLLVSGISVRTLRQWLTSSAVKTGSKM